MPTTNDVWGQFATDNGRWTYGFGQYEKQLNDLAKPPDLYANDTGGWWPTADALIAAFNASGAAVADAAAAQTTFTSYYIYAIDPNGQKRMCGEWTLGQGGRSARDAYFNNLFEPNFVSAPTDRDKIETVIAAAQAAPPPFNLDTFKALAANAVPGPSVTPDGGPPAGSLNKAIALGLAALVVYLVLRR